MTEFYTVLLPVAACSYFLISLMGLCQEIFSSVFLQMNPLVPGYKYQKAVSNLALNFSRFNAPRRRSDLLLQSLLGGIIHR
jgi:hypothetical protein